MIIGILISLYFVFLALYLTMLNNKHFDGYEQPEIEPKAKTDAKNGAGGLKFQKTKNSKKAPSQNYLSTSKEISYELLSLLSIMIPTWILYPGIACSIFPVTLIPKKTYIINLNFFVAFNYLIGRLSGSFNFNHLLIIVNQVLGYIILVFMLVVYFFELNLEYEGLCYTSIFLICFMIYREANAMTFLIIQSGKKAGEQNKEAAG